MTVLKGNRDIELNDHVDKILQLANDVFEV